MLRVVNFYKLAVLFCVVLLVSCSGEKSEVTTGSGSTGITSDGGSGSSSFAGTYTGTITTTISGDEISDETNSDPFVLVVKTDGTATLTISGESIEGVVDSSGNVGFSIVFVEEKDLLECSADAIVIAKISGSSVTGTASGSGECKVIALKTGISLIGSLSGSKS